MQPLWALMAMLVLAGCSVEDAFDASGPGGITIDEVEPYVPMLIRFEGSDGQNLLSAFDDVPQHQSAGPLRLADIPWLDVRCVRGSDGAAMTFSDVMWYVPYNADEAAQLGSGPRLYLSWLDFDWLSAQNVALPSREYYTVYVSSTRFWVGQEHTIRLGLDVSGRRTYSVTSCEVDGRESPEALAASMLDGVFRGVVTLRSAQ